MKAIIIQYDLSDLDQYHKVLFNRALFGFLDNSNKGKYQYNRKGLIHEVPHKRLGRGVILIKQVHKKKIINLFNRHNVLFDAYPITARESMLYYA